MVDNKSVDLISYLGIYDIILKISVYQTDITVQSTIHVSILSSIHTLIYPIFNQMAHLIGSPGPPFDYKTLNALSI